ncbi:ankyrin repeat domain-containing protein 60 [Nematostella vectensis]|uniref:ankyrin repeat domain-containing protein 60 n=1 Tax=Nematostella vectensis TaxID=45351 RepID=UPI002077461A|nr:ankyrin repeat domain-containing protein 60 [Nematostella vectensis]
MTSRVSIMTSEVIFHVKKCLITPMEQVFLPPVCKPFDFFAIMKSGRLKGQIGRMNRGANLSAKIRLFSLHLKFPTDEKFTISRVCPGMTVKDLKNRIELETGVPRHLLRLRYLDGYDLTDDRRLSYYNMVPAATVQVLLWPEWVSLVTAACKGDYYGVLASQIRTPAKLGQNTPREFNEKALVALYIASHRGHVNVVSRLVESGVYPCTKLPSGRSPLHAAVNRKQITCVSILIGRSRGLTEDKMSHDNAVRRSSFLSIANIINKRGGWKLIVRQYEERMRRQREKSKLPMVPRREFQKYDSTFPTHLSGPLARMYLCNILQTEARHAVKRIPRPWY